ncbi:MAG: hypothetical protein EOO43_16170 [Flavobacterium sp.]|nr:MAG: hypothetical protein EOO43_16170 [Flavobacterium sp.]
MKTLSTLFLCLLTLFSFSQDKIKYKTNGPFGRVSDTVPFANATRIVVRTNLNQLDNYKRTKEVLAKMDIKLAGDRPVYGQINTELILLKNADSTIVRCMILILCKETEIVMSCSDKSDKRSKKNGIIMFDKMKEIADQMGGKVYYTN